MDIETSIFNELVKSGPLVLVLAAVAWVSYKDRKASEDRYRELSERGFKAIENSNHIAVEQGALMNRLMDRMEGVHTVVGDCHKHRAAMLETQRMLAFPQNPSKGNG